MPGQPPPDITATSYVMAVPDLSATVRWWRDVMGFEVTLEIDGWTFLRHGACRLRLGHCTDAIPPKDLGDHQYFAYLTVSDANAWHERIKARGGEILLAPTDQPWGLREVAVRTPDGHRLMIAQPLTPV